MRPVLNTANFVRRKNIRYDIITSHTSQGSLHAHISHPLSSRFQPYWQNIWHTTGKHGSSSSSVGTDGKRWSIYTTCSVYVTLERQMDEIYLYSVFVSFVSRVTVNVPRKCVYFCLFAKHQGVCPGGFPHENREETCGYSSPSCI